MTLEIRLLCSRCCCFWRYMRRLLCSFLIFTFLLSSYSYSSCSHRGEDDEHVLRSISLARPIRHFKKLGKGELKLAFLRRSMLRLLCSCLLFTILLSSCSYSSHSHRGEDDGVAINVIGSPDQS